MKHSEETIKLIQQMVADHNISQEIAEMYCPELKLSNDETMRQMAIKAVKSPEAQSCIKSWGIEPDDVIAWLEKKKEKRDMKLLSYIEDAISCVTRCYEENDKEFKQTLHHDLLDIKRSLLKIHNTVRWSPSKKQLNALYDVTQRDDSKITNNSKNLEDLYLDLKALY